MNRINRPLAISLYVMLWLICFYLILGETLILFLIVLGGKIIIYFPGLPFTEEYIGRFTIIPQMVQYIFILFSSFVLLKLGKEYLNKLTKKKGELNDE